MTIYKNIIVAVDLEGGSGDVLRKAQALLADQAANITVLTVVYNSAQMYDGGMGAGIYNMAGSAVDETEIRNSVLPKLEAMAKEYKLPNHHCEVEFGRATNTILEHAQRKSADLIILGSHGRHGLGILLGSTANGVLHKALCDVLAVRLSE